MKGWRVTVGAWATTIFSHYDDLLLSLESWFDLLCTDTCWEQWREIAQLVAEQTRTGLRERVESYSWSLGYYYFLFSQIKNFYDGLWGG